jgi:hypothetical protein
VREFEEGGEKITKQWDQRTGSWQEVARGPRWSPNAGFAITGYDEQGRPLMQMGGQPQTGKVMGNKLDEAQWNAQETVSRLNSIKAGFTPEYQMIGNQLGNEWRTLKDRFGEADPAEKEKITKYTGWRSKAIGNLNAEIKQLTGAAMTEGEAKRLMAGLPNPGSGITNPGDSPTEFEAKLNSSIEGARAAAVRAQLARRKGLDWREVPLDEVDDKLIKPYRRELEQKFQSEGLSPEDAKRQALLQFKAELGL